MQTYYQMPLDELCSLLIGMTRNFIEQFPTNEVSADAIERGSTLRSPGWGGEPRCGMRFRINLGRRQGGPVPTAGVKLSG
nr:hypothetical protein [uncultured Roseovarius sp.]